MLEMNALNNIISLDSNPTFQMSTDAPAWAQPTAGTDAIAPPPSSYVLPVTPENNTLKPSLEEAPSSKANLVQRLLSVLNLGICAAMVATALFALFEFQYSSEESYGEAFVAIYMIIFSALLAAYEIMWWLPVPAVNKSLRKNFGFLYGIKGKSMFIIFVAFLNFGLSDTSSADLGDTGMNVNEFTIILGIIMLVTGVLHLVVWFKYHDQLESYKTPTAGLTPTSDDVTGPV